MKRLFLFITVAWWTLLLPDRAMAAGFDCQSSVPKTETEKLLGKVESRYGEIKTITAEFIQSSYFAGLDRNEVSKGTVAFQTPGLMDWQYQEPKQSRFVADGKTLWFFQPTENQVTLADFSQSFSSDLPVSFLLGIGKISEKFILKNACRTSAGLLVELSPKQTDPGLERFLLLVERASYNPMGARVLDVGGNETTISLLKSKINESFGSNRFTVDLPTGVDVIDRRTKISNTEALNEQDILAQKKQDGGEE